MEKEEREEYEPRKNLGSAGPADSTQQGPLPRENWSMAQVVEEKCQETFQLSERQKIRNPLRIPQRLQEETSNEKSRSSRVGS